MGKIAAGFLLVGFALLVIAPLLGGCQEGVHYQNCEEARAASAAPIQEGEPGYRSALDRNGDGIACEEE
jgi:hypothetical protein